MKVLLINATCKKGSTGKIVYDLYCEMNKNGHAAAICYGRGAAVDESNILKISSDLEMYVHAFLTRITGLTGYFSPFATYRLLKYIREFKPDVVHMHEPKTYYINIGRLVKYLKKNSIKTIWTLHSEFIYTGKCGHSYDCGKWRSGCGRCPDLKGYPRSLFFDFTKKMFRDKKKMMGDFKDIIFAAPSEWLAGRFRQSCLKDKRIRVVRNGIDARNIFHPADTGELRRKYNLSGKKVVLAVAPGLMSDHKGGAWVVELAKRFEAEPVMFILIGAADPSRKFGDNIVALGRTEDQKELAAFYSLADVFVICSKRENFPTTCIEALACGTPVIGFDEGGIRETAPEGYGLFVPFGDVEGISREISLVLQGKSGLKSKADCAVFGCGNYDRQVMYDQYLSLYEKGFDDPV